MRQLKAIVLVILPLLISMGIILSAIHLNNITQFFSPEIVQNIAYIAMLLNTLLFIKLSRKSFQDIGLFFSRLLRQLLTGIVIGTIFFIVGGILIRWRVSFTGNTLYFIISQILVAFSEELLFRGYVLAMLRDIMKTPNQAVLISALVFGLWYYPVSHNISLVLLAALPERYMVLCGQSLKKPMMKSVSFHLLFLIGCLISFCKRYSFTGEDHCFLPFYVQQIMD